MSSEAAQQPTSETARPLPPGTRLPASRGGAQIVELHGPTPAAPGAFAAPPSDLSQWLPEAAQRVLVDLKQKRADAYQLMEPLLVSLPAKRLDAQQARNRIAELTAHPQDHGHNLPASHAAVV